MQQCFLFGRKFLCKVAANYLLLGLATKLGDILSSNVFVDLNMKKHNFFSFGYKVRMTD